MPDVAIREARAGDREVLRRLTLESTLQPAGGGAHLEPAEEPGAPEGATVFLAEVDGHAAGYVAVREAAGALRLERLVVAPADQGRHVGHALLDWVEGYGVSRGLDRVEVERAGADVQAEEFYRRRGFEETAPGLLCRPLAHR
jgi:ribosomal protein S18 acetylase RimI-like enzyme